MIEISATSTEWSSRPHRPPSVCRDGSSNVRTKSPISVLLHSPSTQFANVYQLLCRKARRLHTSMLSHYIRTRTKVNRCDLPDRDGTRSSSLSVAQRGRLHATQSPAISDASAAGGGCNGSGVSWQSCSIDAGDCPTFRCPVCGTNRPGCQITASLFAVAKNTSARERCNNAEPAVASSTNVHVYAKPKAVVLL